VLSLRTPAHRSRTTAAIPTDTDDANTTPRACAVKLRRRKPLTIVLVHEDAAVLELMEEVLREGGHRVLATKDPAEGRDVVHRVVIDLVVVDARDRNAAEGFVRELRAIQPATRVLNMSDQPVSLTDLKAAVSAYA
jgi:DNA-binding NtrC family response regulator